MLLGGSGFREFELDLRTALLAAAGASEVLSSLDGELEAPPCGECGSARRRRGTRSVSPLSLLGRLELRRGYWTCKCAKGGTHLLDEALGVLPLRACVQSGLYDDYWRHRRKPPPLAA